MTRVDAVSDTKRVEGRRCGREVRVSVMGLGWIHHRQYRFSRRAEVDEAAGEPHAVPVCSFPEKRDFLPGEFRAVQRQPRKALERLMDLFFQPAASACRMLASRSASAGGGRLTGKVSGNNIAVMEICRPRNTAASRPITSWSLATAKDLRPSLQTRWAVSSTRNRRTLLDSTASPAGRTPNTHPTRAFLDSHDRREVVHALASRKQQENAYPRREAPLSRYEVADLRRVSPRSIRISTMRSGSSRARGIRQTKVAPRAEIRDPGRA